MTVNAYFEAGDFAHLARALDRLPQEIKTKALTRAMRRVGETARSRIARRQMPRLDIPAKTVRELTTLHFNAGGNSSDMVLRSGWIPLYKLGATGTPEGVSVKLRGSYRHAFIATMLNTGKGEGKGDHTGVFRRVRHTRMSKKSKEQIRELFGPNPAHDVNNHPEVYEQVLAEVISDTLLLRFIHEASRLLPK